MKAINNDVALYLTIVSLWKQAGKSDVLLHEVPPANSSVNVKRIPVHELAGCQYTKGELRAALKRLVNDDKIYCATYAVSAWVPAGKYPRYDDYSYVAEQTREFYKRHAMVRTSNLFAVSPVDARETAVW